LSRKLFWGVLLGAIVLGGTLAAWDVYRFLRIAPQTPGEQRIVTISPGLSMRGISHLLEDRGLIRDATRFRIYARIVGLSTSVHAGEFALNTGWVPRAVLDALTSGQVYLHRLRFPEGLTWWQTGRIVEQSGLASFESFSRAVHDQQLLRRYHIPGDSAEGFLFPETYHLPRPPDQDARPIVEMMLENFWRTTDSALWPAQRPEQDRIREMVILASLVERETARPEERERIAGVFANRLRRNMRLQCDPTIIYGLGPDFTDRLRRIHLDDPDNAYNTYLHGGLPPGPIASPGLASLQAVLQPEDHDLLYFVSRGDGSHAFSKTLREHNRAVRSYQLGR